MGPCFGLSFIIFVGVSECIGIKNILFFGGLFILFYWQKMECSFSLFRDTIFIITMELGNGLFSFRKRTSIDHYALAGFVVAILNRYLAVFLIFNMFRLKVVKLN